MFLVSDVMIRVGLKSALFSCPLILRVLDRHVFLLSDAGILCILFVFPIYFFSPPHTFFCSQCPLLLQFLRSEIWASKKQVSEQITRQICFLRFFFI